MVNSDQVAAILMRNAGRFKNGFIPMTHSRFRHILAKHYQ